MIPGIGNIRIPCDPVNSCQLREEIAPALFTNVSSAPSIGIKIWVLFNINARQILYHISNHWNPHRPLADYHPAGHASVLWYFLDILGCLEPGIYTARTKDVPAWNQTNPIH